MIDLIITHFILVCIAFFLNGVERGLTGNKYLSDRDKVSGMLMLLFLLPYVSIPLSIGNITLNKIGKNK